MGRSFSHRRLPEFFFDFPVWSRGLSTCARLDFTPVGVTGACGKVFFLSLLFRACEHDGRRRVSPDLVGEGNPLFAASFLWFSGADGHADRRLWSPNPGASAVAADHHRPWYGRDRPVKARGPLGPLFRPNESPRRRRRKEKKRERKKKKKRKRKKKKKKKKRKENAK